MLGVIRETFEREGGSMSGEDDFFSVARTMPFVALSEMSTPNPSDGSFLQEVPLIPRDVTPWLTALRAYSELPLVKLAVAAGYGETAPICTSLPLRVYQ